MVGTSFLPSLSQLDIERASQLIQQAYAPPTVSTTPEGLRRYQQELFEIQKRPEAWGLVIPLLEHQDQNVQFFGAHTAQVKIARDWDSFPTEHVESLRDLLLQLTAHAVAIGRSKFILRKLFVALTSLALKLVPGRPTRWPDWILSCVASFSGHRGSPETIHDFLSIVAEEMGGADLLGSSKLQVQQTLLDATPMVVQAITTSINQSATTIQPQQVQSALRCLQAWMSTLRANDLTTIIPMLINLLDPLEDNEQVFVAASDALQELLSKSAFSDGSGSKSLTEPLLLWFDTVGNKIIETSLNSGDISETSHSLCKLLVALGDHSTSYIAANLTSATLVSPSTKSKGQLSQGFLRLLLAYTGLPGIYGVDEEESEMTLGFWYLFQEALWTTDYYFPEAGDDESRPPTPGKENDQVIVAKAVYVELVQILRRKVVFPPPGSGWTKDQIEKFQVYRRDVGDTLINAYYVLRDDMLAYYVNDIETRLSTRQEGQGWQDIEATLHCIMSVQEALDVDKASHLTRLFSPTILGRLPSTGHGRIRRTTLGVIGAYSSWFATQPILPPSSTATNVLLTVLSYVVTALTDSALCLQAAVALRNLCDANRKALAPHIAAFGELHAGLEQIPDSERSKVLQSIASVIQALPPIEEIPPIEGIVDPIVDKLGRALRSSVTLPDEARAATILQLEILTGVSKGLTRTTDVIYSADEESPAEKEEAERVKTARNDLRMIKLRDELFNAIRSVVDMWSMDSEISHALSELFKSITCIPSDTTLISLPAGPLLELVCLAAQRHLTAAWLSLSAILIAQLNPPVFSLTLKSGPTKEAEATVASALPILLQCGLAALGVPGAMETNPDVVQEFFACMDRIAQDFTSTFYFLPPGALGALMQCAISSLSLQERYSLVSAANFLTTFIHRSSLTEELLAHKTALLAAHGPVMMRAILQGFAGVAPRSVVPNLIEMLGMLMNRSVGSGADGAAKWMQDILFADDFVPCKAGPDVKEKFLKAVVSSRSLKKTRDAAQQFTLVARGLEGSSFGYTSVTM